MTQPTQPARVIYAKLTSTGDYDVVAKTDNIDINAARSLAERLLLGNVPHDASIAEELAYLRPPEGGHLIIRYTTYNWRDAHRGGAFMTDVVWLNDEDFARARNNAFAVMPSSDDVYDVLTTLPPPVVDERTAAQDIERLAALDDAHAALMTLAPAVLLGDTVLSIDRADRRRRMELFTLLLPPRLRPALTFQTRAFRVPSYPPRVTLSDELHANLQAGPWKHVLPNVSLDVPVGLASRLADAARSPGTLNTAHALFEKTGVSTDHMREEVTRVVDLIAFSDALEAKDMATAFRLAVTGRHAEVEAKLTEVFNQSSPSDIRTAVTSGVDAGGDGESLALHLMSAIEQTDAATATQLQDEAARRLIATGRMPGAHLGAYLIRALATAGNADALVLLLAIDPRAAAGMVPSELPDTAIGGFAGALSEASRVRRDLAGARRIVDPTVAIAPHVTEPAAIKKLVLLCREGVEAALDKAVLESRDIREIVNLQASADALIERSPALRDALPALFSDRQLAGQSAADAATAATARSEQLNDDAAAAIAAALVLRSADGGSGGSVREIRVAAAGALLASLQPPLRARVQRVLEEMGTGADALLGLKGGEELLPLLGRSTEQAASTRDLLQAVRDLGATDDAIARLATVVLAARNGHLTLSRSHQGFAPLKAAFADAMDKRCANGTHRGILEIALELLATITDTDAFAELEQAGVANGGMTVRLRRLDRAVALCRAAEDEVAYEQLALAIESPDTQISDASRQRLRDALGTGGLQRRIIQMITGVVERGAQ